MLRTGNDRKKWYIRVEYDLSGGGGGVGGGGGGGGDGWILQEAIHVCTVYMCIYMYIPISRERSGALPTRKKFLLLWN